MDELLLDLKYATEDAYREIREDFRMSSVAKDDWRERVYEVTNETDLDDPESVSKTITWLRRTVFC